MRRWISTWHLWFVLVALLTTTWETCAQDRSPLPPPPTLLKAKSELEIATSFPTTETVPLTDLDRLSSDADAHLVDPYFDVPPNNQGLNFFHTRSIPFGSWSDEASWPAETTHSTTIQRYRKAFYQKTDLSSSWVAQDGQTGLGLTRASASITLAVGKPTNLVLVSPAFDSHFLQGPTSIDVPSRLYSAYANLLWRWEINDNWGTLVAVRPGYFSDFESSDFNGFRTSGFVAVSWNVFPDQLSVFAGAVYLNRNDVDVIPAAGFIWTPCADFRVDMIFPKPKIAKRIGHIPYVNEDWVYLTGGFGGGTWDVQRTSGTFDELTLRDFRLALGFERIIDGGTGWFAEAGWIFKRQLEYEISGEKIDFADSFGIEGGFSF